LSLWENIFYVVKADTSEN